MIQTTNQHHEVNHRTTCRHCGHPLGLSMVDLGAQPPCEAILAEEQFYEPEPFYPLHARVCENCWLVQLDADVSPEKIYTEYAYYSSYSESWLKHMESYTDAICNRLALTSDHRVVEIASNDGYLLQYFAKRGIPCFGIDPAANVAEKAQERGIETLVSFFTTEAAEQIVKERGKADLIIANNVFGHIPDINDFLQGVQRLLQEGGTITIEIPHLLRLIEGNQFDTIYHEHYCYHTLIADLKLLESQGLKLISVEELSTHGGSIRMFIAHREDARAPDDSIERLVAIERAKGMDTPAPYQAFGEKVRQTKRNLLRFLIAAKEEGKRIVGYGAPGKGNTLLNYCGIREDFLDFVVDRNPYKHAKFLPGSRIPIRPVEAVYDAKPDFLLILPWNISEEIMQQMDGVRDWGCQFVIPIPEVRVVA